METGPKWYITRGQQRIGPLDASQLKHMAMTEQLGPTEYVWKEGMAQWVQAQQVQGLFDKPAAEEVEDAAAPGDRADVSPAIAPYTPPAQQAAAPLIAGSATPAAASSTTSATPAKRPAESPELTPARGATAPAAAPVKEKPAAPVVTENVVQPAAKPAATATPQRAAPPVAVAPRPALAGRAPLPGVSTALDPFVPIVGAVLILATIAIPWKAAPEYRYGPVKLEFSWDVLKREFGAGGVAVRGVLMIAAWAAAVAAIIVTPIMRGTVRGAVYAVLGAVAAGLFLVAYPKIPMNADHFKSGMSELERPLTLVMGMLMVAAVVVTHLIRRSGPNTALKVAQLVASGGLAVVSIILVITAFAAAKSLWSQYGSYPVKAPYSGLLRANVLVTGIGAAVAGTLLAISALIGGRRTILNGAGLLLLYVIALLALAATVPLHAGARDRWETIYAEGCAMLIALGSALILGAGLVQMIDHLRRAGAPVIATGVRPAGASSTSGETVEQKFAKLDQLRKTGVISESEYQQKRAELLKQL